MQPKLEAHCLVYGILPDRFGNPNSEYRKKFPVEPWNPNGYQGGSYENIHHAIEINYFSAMGVGAIKLLGTPQKVRPGYRLYQGHASRAYYGYEIISLREPDLRLGDYQALRKLIVAAHEDGTKVLLDTVPHMDESANLCIKRPDLFSGTAGYDHLRMFDFRNAEAVDMLWDSYEYWLATGADGVRLDSLMHQLVWDNATDKFVYLKNLFREGPFSSCYAIGEAYEGDYAVWSAFLNTGCPMLYNYPLYFHLARGLACPWGDYVEIRKGIRTEYGNLNALAEMVLTMVRDGVFPRCLNFIDNHDVDRFLTLVYQAKGSNDERFDRRLESALKVLMTLPGVPCIFQGTEDGKSGQGTDKSTSANRATQDLAYAHQFLFTALIRSLADLRKRSGALNSHQSGYEENWRPQGPREPQIWSYTRFARGSKAITTVNNNSEYPVELSNLAGGIAAHRLRPGKLINALTRSESGLEVTSDNRIVGTIPAVTTLIVRNA